MNKIYPKKDFLYHLNKSFTQIVSTHPEIDVFPAARRY